MASSPAASKEEAIPTRSPCSYPLQGQASDFIDQATGPRPVPYGYVNAYGRTMAEEVDRGDLDVLVKGFCSLTPLQAGSPCLERARTFRRRAPCPCVSLLQVWPEAHPLSFRDSVMRHATLEDADGLPLWLTRRYLDLN